MENPGLVGVIFFIIGGIFIALTFGLLRLTPKPRTDFPASTSSVEDSSNGKAILIIAPGGRVNYLNQTAREWFGILEEIPNLERLAKRARPGDSFMSLCSNPGKASFSLHGRMVKGESIELPYNGSRTVLVSLQKLPPARQPGEGDSLTELAVEVFTGLSQSMASSLDLEATLTTILKSVENLIPSDYPEITIWDPELHHLIPYRFTENDGQERVIEKSTDRYLSSEGYSGYLISEKRSLLIGSVDEYPDVRPAVDRRKIPFNSYLGIPLIIADQPVGTLELASIEKDFFNEDELEVLRILSGPAAVALHNALLYREEQKRIIELSGLSKLTQAAASLHDQKDLYGSLVESIGPLLNVNVLGFWIYDEQHHILQAQAPFIGVHSDVISISEVSIEAESQAEEILSEQELIISPFAVEDARLEALNLAQWTGAAGIKSIVLAPLASHNRPIGYLMAADRIDGEFFNQDDLRLISIIASQAAMIIENATLVQQTQKRVLRSEALRRIASLTGSTARMEEILQYSLLELARLLQADTAVIFLVDETLGKLCLHRESLFGIPEDLIEEFKYLSADITLSHFGKIKRSLPQYYLTADVFENIEALPIYKPFFDHIQIRSVINVPLIVRNHLIGEVMLGNRQTNFYDHSDLTIIATAASQLASAIEQFFLYKQTDETLRERIDRISSVVQKIRELTASSDIQELLKIVFDEVADRTTADCGSILIFEHDRKKPNILYQAGDPHENNLSLIEEKAWKQDRPVVIDDYYEPHIRLGSNRTLPHPEVRSSLIVPISYKEIKTGLIHLHSQKPGAFSTADIELIQILAVQTAITVSNILLYQNQKLNAEQLKHKYETLSKQFEKELLDVGQALQDAKTRLAEINRKDEHNISTILRLEESANRIRAGLEISEIVSRKPDRLQVIIGLAKEIQAKLKIDLVLVAEPSPGGPRLLHMIGDLPAGTNPEALLGSRNPIRHCLQTGSNLLVPDLNKEPDWNNSPLLQSIHVKGFICLTIPLELNGSNALVGNKIDETSRYIEFEDAAVDAVLLGMSLSPLVPFTPEDAHLFKLLTSQVAIALQNQRLLYETNRRLREVNLLLDFSRRLGSLNPTEILGTLLDSSLMVTPSAQAGMVMMWDPDQSALVPLAAQGYPEKESLLEIRFHPKKTIPGRVFADGIGMRVDEVEFAVDYDMPLEQLIRYRNATGGRLPTSTLIVPISASTRPSYDSDGDEGKTTPLGVLVLENFHLISAFTQEDQALVTSLAQQTALTLENARLYQASEQRALQLQTLTEVSATITSSLQTDELIATLLDHVISILPYDTGTLWIRKEEVITIHAARGFMDQEERAGLSVKVEDSLLLKEMLHTGKPIYVGDTSADSRFTTLVSPEYLSWLGIPLISKGEVVGVIALEKAEQNFYTSEQIQAATTFAGQAAVALENAQLYEDSLHRAQELDQRSQRLGLLNRLSFELSSSMEIEYILRLSLQELKLAIDCSAVSAVLFDKQDRGWIQAESPKTTESLPQELPNIPLFDKIRDSLGIYSVEDIATEENLISPLLTPIEDYLKTRTTVSLFVLPLFTGSDLHGLIFVHKDIPYHYGYEEMELARTICNQAAAALQNARLFAETQFLYAESRQRSSELASLYEMGMSISQILDVEPLIDVSFEHLTDLIKVDTCALVLTDEEGNLSAYGIEHGEKIGPIPLEKSGASFSEYVLKDGRPLLISDIDRERKTLPVPGKIFGSPVKSWFGIPLIVRGSTIGVLSVQSDSPDLFGEEHQRLVGQVASQLAIALDNARLFSTVQKYTSELELRVAERTAQLAREHKRTETLLGVIKELSTSLDIEIVLNKTLSLVNEATNAENSEIILKKTDDEDLYLCASYKSAQPAVGEEGSSYQDSFTIAEEVLAKRGAVLIGDRSTDPVLVNRKEELPEKLLSVLAVPLKIGEEILGALLLYNPYSGQFLPDRIELVEAMAKQISVTINNTQLFQLIRDQAGSLGDMLRQQHVETSRSQAILEAVADGVLVTDSNRTITLFNRSAEQTLGLDRESVVGNSLDHFSGLFGKAGKTWVNTVRHWSEDPSTYESGEIFTEQIELDDQRVISVHLSPVHLRQDFLGTVSTFRDITHQVEVDRLKSEFVATVSHELRTPMTSIKGYVEVLLMGAAGELNEQQAHFLNVVKDNTERLAILVNDLLDVSRIEAGKIELNICPLDLTELVEKAVSDLRNRSNQDNKAMIIETFSSPNLPKAAGDEERVRQILDNLLENAYAYTQAGGKITIKLSPIEEGVQVDILDNGIGIIVKDQARIFERFYRGEAPLVLSTPGTGLGLSIVERLIEMHNGKIWFYSSGIQGEGSTFSFVLPLCSPAA